MICSCFLTCAVPQIDPIRTISAGKVNLGAFRTYPKVKITFYFYLYSVPDVVPTWHSTDVVTLGRFMASGQLLLQRLP